MERKIGETFEFEGKKLQVKESEEGSCNFCFFNAECKNGNLHVSRACDGAWREDGKNVIFVEVQEPKKERFDPKMLKPFDKILVRNSCIDNWGCSFFSNHRKDELFPFLTCDASAVKYCVPYNDDTKHLIGTTEEVPEYYRYWED